MSSNSTVGIALAAVSSLPFAAYIMPRKLCKLRVVEYQFWLGLAVVPVCLLAVLFAGAPFGGSRDALLYSFVCGPIWVLGSLSYSSAVDRIGVARSTPVKNFAPAFASLYGIVLFGEYTIRDLRSLGFAVGGLLLMTAAAWILGRASAPEHETATAFSPNLSESERRKALMWGFLFSLSAAFFYGLYAAPLKVSVAREGLDPFTACLYLGLGVLAAGIVVYWVRERRLYPPTPSRRDFMLSQMAGALWTPAQILGTLAMVHVAMSISWPTSNLSTLIAIAWGVFVFKEVHLEKHKGELVLSVLCYAAGVTMLVFAAPHGRV